MFSSSSLRFKLLSSYGFCVFCLLVVGTAGYYGLTQTESTFSHVSDVVVPNLKAMEEIVSAQKDIVIAVSRIQGTHATANEVATAQTRVSDALRRFDEGSKLYESSPWAAGEEEKWKSLKNDFAPFQELATKAISLSATGTKEDEKTRDEILTNRFEPIVIELDKGFDELVAFQEKESTTWVSEAKSDASESLIMIAVVVAIGFTLALAFGFIISSSLSSTLRSLAARLSSGADEVASASHQVAASSEQLSSSSNEQAASLQETVASVEEMSAMIGKNAENAKNSQGVSASSQTSAEKGKSAVSDMIQAMDEINTSNSNIMRQVEVSNGQISDIVKVIAEIGNKTKVINDIVFQTKLLSFNASVEAARAGEHGKGFAVVAEEVGNLAQMSGAAAKEISSMLDVSIKKVEEIVAETKDKVEGLIQNGKSKIEKGTEVARRCSEVLEEMVVSVGEVNRMVGEISVASQEQATGVAQINIAMGQLDQVTQQNASASQETASAAESLTTQASQLRSMVIELMQTVDGSNASGRTNTLKTKNNNNENSNVVALDTNAKGTRKTTSDKNTTKAKSTTAKKEAPSRDNVRFGTG